MACGQVQGLVRNGQGFSSVKQSMGAHLCQRGAFLMASRSAIQAAPMAASARLNWPALAAKLYRMSCRRSTCGML